MLEKIYIEGYRNLKNVLIECEKEGVIFLGKNGQGKTNILEAIYSLSIGKAFRSNVVYDAICFDDQAFHIQAKTPKGGLEIHAANTPRKQVKYVVHDAKTKFFDFLGNFHAVLFSPEDLEVIRGAPGKRRNYLDSVLVRLDKEYAFQLGQYEKALKQRNVLLKGINDGSSSYEQLDIWNNLLNEYAQPLWEKREVLLNGFQEKIADIYTRLAKKDSSVRIEYQKKCESDDFIADLKAREQRDILLGSTSVGPHRDDFALYLNDHESAEFASQGETRSLILALKYCEIEALESQHGHSIVLLLDDVFSELDLERQGALLELAQERQTFITTTHLDDALPVLGKVYEVKEGEINPS